MVATIGYILLVAIIGSCFGQNGADLSTDNMKYIEAALTNISSHISHYGPDTAISDSLTTVTSLLQLSLLKGILADSDNSNNISEQEVLALLNRLETLLNTTVNNQQIIMIQGNNNQHDIIQLQEELSSVYSTLNTVKSDIKTILQHTLANSNGSVEEITASNVPHSCEEIKSSLPEAPSDYYKIVDSDGHTHHVYCYMEELCESSDGWTRVAYLDMTDTDEKCPDGFKLYEINGVRACGRYSTGCTSTTFPSDGISYSEVCGKVIGYQYGSPDGAYASVIINGVYLDGISLTHGNPRAHIWSFISGHYESVSSNACPCGTVDSKPVPDFVGKHYYCEAAAVPEWQLKLYTDDPLWDGKGCGSIEGPCCSVPGIPWFHRTFSYTTSDTIELRVCGNEGITNEDVPVSYYEIYVK